MTAIRHAGPGRGLEVHVAPAFGRRAFGLLLLGATLPACRRAERLPVLGQLPAFRFVDQAGQPFTEASLAGAPSVVAFVFTRCPSVCPRMLERMKALHGRVAARGIPLRLLAISVDPEHDTPPVLAAWAERHGVVPGSITFVTGDPEQVRRVSVEGFKLALEGKADPKRDHFGILHASYLTLVDAQGRLRGYYRTTDDTLDQLVADLGRL